MAHRKPATTESKPIMIVITAPTGSIGRQVVDNLLAAGAAVRVIARDPARLPAAIRARVEVVQGSHGDIDVLHRAFEGAAAVFWLVPPNPQAVSLEAAYLDFARPACQALTDRGVQRVVGVSALGRGLPVNAGYVTASLAMDDLIAATGVNYRALLMPSFMDNLLRQVEAIDRQGVFFSPIAGEMKNPTCATRDIAAVAARWLLDDSWSGQGSAAVLGAEDLSFNDMARILTEVLGKPVRFQQISGEAFKARLTGFGTSEAMAQGALDMMIAKNQGLDHTEPRTAESTTPTSFRQWCDEVLKPAIALQKQA
ncbi:MAG: NmrA family transcriptional regulator [Polaromonas sp.]|nr:NmrA family transcriptional regulator [Polaromonas sp.]